MTDVDVLWPAVVEVCSEVGPVYERPSQWGGKPALFLDRREIAHYDGDGIVDVRITASGWKGVAFGDDPAVTRDRSRRDWVSIRIASTEDLERLRPLLEAAVRANGA
jgi:Family of unknown function (DUF5519)